MSSPQGTSAHKLLALLAALAYSALPPTLPTDFLARAGMPHEFRPWHVYSRRPIRVGDSAIPVLVDGHGYTGPGSIAVDNIAAWIGYGVDLVGLGYPAAEVPTAGRYWTIDLAEHPRFREIGLWPWRQRAIPDASPAVYAEVRQVPGDWDAPDPKRPATWDAWEHAAICQQRRMLPDDANAPSSAEQAQAEHGLALLRQLAWQAEQTSRARQLAEAAARIRGGRRPLTRDSLADEFGVASSTIDKWVKPVGGMWALGHTPLADLQRGRITARKGKFEGS